MKNYYVHFIPTKGIVTEEDKIWFGKLYSIPCFWFAFCPFSSKEEWKSYMESLPEEFYLAGFNNSKYTKQQAIKFCFKHPKHFLIGCYKKNRAGNTKLVSFYKPFPSKEKAIKFIEYYPDTQVSKAYKCFVLTEEQYNAREKYSDTVRIIDYFGGYY